MVKVIKRDYYLEKIISKQWNGRIKVITGVRRSGKSYLLFKLFYDYLISFGVDKEQIITIQLDNDFDLDKRDTKILSSYIRSKITNDKKYYVFIDEVQYAISKDEQKNVDEIKLYNVLNGLLTLNNVDVYVTGSNSKLLTKDVLTSFRGRGDEIKIYPLTFKEYYDFVGGDISMAYGNYITYGGMPYTLSLESNSEKSLYLSTLFEEVYFKDILERYTIEYPNVLLELTDELFSTIGSLTNAKKISDTLLSVQKIKISSSVIAKYLTFLKDSFLFNESKRYDIKGKKYFEYPSKLYCVDVGLRNARLNYRQMEETHLMENVIYNELLSRGYMVDVGVIEIVEINAGVRKKKNIEIDFIASMGNQKYYIQSALNIDNPEKKKIELRPFNSTNDFFKKIIITKTFLKPYYDENGILNIGILDFLLDKNSLEK